MTYPMIPASCMDPSLGRAAWRTELLESVVDYTEQEDRFGAEHSPALLVVHPRLQSIELRVHLSPQIIYGALLHMVSTV